MAYLRRFHNQTETTMVPTRSLAERLGEAGFERLQVVARGVDTTVFDPALRDEGLRASWRAGPDTPVLLCVGRLAKEKNLPLLVRAYAQARLLRPDLKLVLVGDGPARAELQAQAPEAIFTGQLDRPALARHYASADVFAFPSRTETFGNVVLEAMASGLAVLAYDYAAASENIEHGRNGLLVALDDEESFVRQLCDLAHNDALRARLRTASREAARQNEWGGIVAQIESVMKLAITGHRGAKHALLPSVAPQQMA
jgi:glycosyltransferase involved in cell wall biosynthesis